MMKLFTPTAAVLALGLLTTNATHSASTLYDRDQGASAAEAISNIKDSDPDLFVDPAEINETSSTFESTTDTGASISISKDPEHGVEIITSEGDSIHLRIPEPQRAEAVSLSGEGLIGFEGTDGFTTSVVPTDGGAQFFTTITDAAAPERFTYEIDLPAGTALTEQQETGGLVAKDDDGELVLLVAPAWAKDANGEDVSTRFEIQDDTLVQIIDHHGSGVAYPIVADPNVNSTLIKSYKWVKSSTGYTISVAVTPAMGWYLSGPAYTDGWAQLTKAVKANSATEHKRLNTVAMNQQWACHAAGKALIGIGGWVGIDKKPTWDLETWRKMLSGSTYQVASTYVSKRCNW